MYKKIIAPFEYKFNIQQSGLYSIIVTASCKSGKIMGLFGGEDLRAEIDGIKLREIPAKNKPQYKDIPPAWNGSRLKGLSKIVIFIVRIEQGDRTIKFIPYRGAIIEKELEIKLIQNSDDVDLKITEQAQDGDRRPWITLALIDLPLKRLDASVKCEKRFLDSDDVKLIIDGSTQKNQQSGLRKNWYWQGGRLHGDTEEARFYADLPAGVHYVEFWADRKPILHWVKMDLGLTEESMSENNGIPTVDNPKWTGDFNNDSAQMILARAIFGEARSEILSDKARIAVGWSIRNRVEDTARFGNNYHEVILKENQYSAFRKSDENRPYVEDPLHKNNLIDKRAWENCYKIAGQVMRGEIGDPTDGANHYYDESIESPYWANNKNFKVKIDSLFFHRL